METFLSDAIVLDALLISVLLALWITSFMLRGLFWLLRTTGRPIEAPMVRTIRVVGNPGQGNQRREAA